MQKGVKTILSPEVLASQELIEKVFWLMWKAFGAAEECLDKDGGLVVQITIGEVDNLDK